MGPNALRFGVPGSAERAHDLSAGYAIARCDPDSIKVHEEGDVALAGPLSALDDDCPSVTIRDPRLPARARVDDPARERRDQRLTFRGVDVDAVVESVRAPVAVDTHVVVVLRSPVPQ